MKDDLLLQGFKKYAEYQLKREAYGFCTFFFYQPKLPEGLKEKLKNKK